MAKAHGGPIEIYGVTVAHVDDKVRLQAVDTWFDPLEMFRQIAPHGIINKTPMNRKVDLESALDVGPEFAPAKPRSEDPSNGADGVSIAQQHERAGTEHGDEPAPEDVIPKHISNSTGKPADAFVPHQRADTDKKATEQSSAPPAAQTDAPSSAQTLVDAAATQGAHADVEKPESNFHDAQEHQTEPPTAANPEDVSSGPTTSTSDSTVPRSIYTSSVTGAEENVIKAARSGEYVDEQVRYGTHDAVDEHLEKSAAEVHPHSHATEDAVKPQPGEAIAVPADAEEARATHEEMSRISAGECPFLMNRE